jgi:RHS repeat-associated protein
VLTITTFDPAIAGGSKAVNYTVLVGDTLTTIATNMAAAINADTALQAIAVSATSSGTVLNIKSASANATTYTKSTSGGATETIALAPSTSGTQYGYNNLNEMTSIAAGGATRWQGTTNKALKSATVNGAAAFLPYTQSFASNASLANGTNNVPVAAVDGSNTTKTNSYQVSTNGSNSTTPTYDLNANMISDGTNSYVWDAENRLLTINYPGSNNYSSFNYDSNSRNTRIDETSAGILSSSKQFIWASEQRREERDSSGALVKQFFPRGQRIGATNSYYTLDQINSLREVTDDLGVIQAAFTYDQFGNVDRLKGLMDVDMQFAGYFTHKRSALGLCKFRSYNPRLARWLSRDPIYENGGINLYAYVDNSPVDARDPSGLKGPDGGGSPTPSPSPSPTPTPNPSPTPSPEPTPSPDPDDDSGPSPSPNPEPGPSPDPDPNPNPCKKACRSYFCCQDNWKKCRDECFRRYGSEKLVRCISCCGIELINCYSRIRRKRYSSARHWKNCFADPQT